MFPVHKETLNPVYLWLHYQGRNSLKLMHFPKTFVWTLSFLSQ